MAMSVNLINIYVWLLDTIYRAKRISYEEINEKWMDCEMSGGLELPKRTFHKWRGAIKEIFGIFIENEESGAYLYYVFNEEDIHSNGIRNWIFNTVSVSNILLESQSIKHRILLENVPSSHLYLLKVIEALKENKRLLVTYKSYMRDEASKFEVEPYCIKLFLQRLISFSSFLFIYPFIHTTNLQPPCAKF